MFNNGYNGKGLLRTLQEVLRILWNKLYDNYDICEGNPGGIWLVWCKYNVKSRRNS